MLPWRVKQRMQRINATSPTYNFIKNSNNQRQGQLFFEIQ